jgi:hypothetical protein
MERAGSEISSKTKLVWVILRRECVIMVVHAGIVDGEQDRAK